MDTQNIQDNTNSVPLQGVGVRREDLQFLPISLNVTNKKILLIGGGKVATHKGTIMARFVQNVTVIAPKFTDEIRQLPFTFVQKEYEPSDLEGFFLVYVCTGDHELNAKIKAKKGLQKSLKKFFLAKNKNGKTPTKIIGANRKAI